jgi:hypothetical protein
LVVPYILDEFTFFETLYSETDPGFTNCDIEHPAAVYSKTRMHIVNHMPHKKISVIEIPDKAAVEVTNSVDNIIKKQYFSCFFKCSGLPNVVLLKLYEYDYRYDIWKVQRIVVWSNRTSDSNAEELRQA